MQDGTGNKHPRRKSSPDSYVPDTFSGYMRRRLENHRLPVDGDGWEALEARLRREGLDKAPGEESGKECGKEPAKECGTEQGTEPSGVEWSAIGVSIAESPIAGSLGADLSVDASAVDPSVVASAVDPSVPKPLGYRMSDTVNTPDLSVRPEKAVGRAGMKQRGSRWRIWLWTAAAVLTAWFALLPFFRNERTGEWVARETRLENNPAVGTGSVNPAQGKAGEKIAEKIAEKISEKATSDKDKIQNTSSYGNIILRKKNEKSADPTRKTKERISSPTVFPPRLNQTARVDKDWEDESAVQAEELAVQTEDSIALAEKLAARAEERIARTEELAARAEERIARAEDPVARKERSADPVGESVTLAEQEALLAHNETGLPPKSPDFIGKSLDRVPEDSLVASHAAPVADPLISSESLPSPGPLPAADRRSLAVRKSLKEKKNLSLSQKPLTSRWLLAARVGTEGNLSLPEAMNLYDASPPVQDGSVSDPPFSDEDGTRPPSDPSLPSHDLTDRLSPENFSEADYLPPLSFGLSVRKNLTPRLGVETGLVYTFLASRFVNRGTVRGEARLELHYLGIPLHLVVYLWDRSRWNLYVTAGGMVEKGLRSSYSFTEYKDAHVFTVDRKETIDGLQWSLNASIGMSYQLFKSWSLYLEPRFSYYFDSRQPASIRTDKPLGIGLGGGVRYAF